MVQSGGGLGGFLDSTLYTLETGFDFFAKEVAFALIPDSHGRDAHGDAGEEEGDTSTVANDSTTIMSTIQIIRQELNDVDDDELTFEEYEARQDTKQIFRPAPFDPTKADFNEQYAELVRMASDNYQMDSSSSIGGNVRQRIKEYEMAQKLLEAGFTNGSSKLKMKPSPEGMPRKRSTGLQKPPAGNNNDLHTVPNTSVHLQAVKEKRRALELAPTKSAHVQAARDKRRTLQLQLQYLEQQLAKQQKKNKARKEREQKVVSDPPVEQKVVSDPLVDGGREQPTTPNLGGNTTEEKLAALERRHRKIVQKQKALKKADRRSEWEKEMESIQAEIDRMAVEDFFAKVPNTKEEEDFSEKSLSMLGLDPEPVETPAKRKRTLNEKAHRQLREMMHDQLILEDLRRVVGREHLPSPRQGNDDVGAERKRILEERAQDQLRDKMQGRQEELALAASQSSLDLRKMGDQQRDKAQDPPSTPRSGGLVAERKRILDEKAGEQLRDKMKDQLRRTEAEGIARREDQPTSRDMDPPAERERSLNNEKAPAQLPYRMHSEFQLKKSRGIAEKESLPATSNNKEPVHDDLFLQRSDDDMLMQELEQLLSSESL